jgi:hypothetical protein
VLREALGTFEWHALKAEFSSRRLSNFELHPLFLLGQRALASIPTGCSGTIQWAMSNAAGSGLDGDRWEKRVRIDVELCANPTSSSTLSSTTRLHPHPTGKSLTYALTTLSPIFLATSACCVSRESKGTFSACARERYSES